MTISLGFETHGDAEAFAESVRTCRRFIRGSMTLVAPPGSRLTARVVGPEQTGCLFCPFAVEVGIERHAECG